MLDSQEIKTSHQPEMSMIFACVNYTKAITISKLLQNYKVWQNNITLRALGTNLGPHSGTPFALRYTWCSYHRLLRKWQAGSRCSQHHWRSTNCTGCPLCRLGCRHPWWRCPVLSRDCLHKSRLLSTGSHCMWSHLKLDKVNAVEIKIVKKDSCSCSLESPGCTRLWKRCPMLSQDCHHRSW